MMFHKAFFATIIVGVVVATDDTERLGGRRLWRDDLPWEELTSSLSASASLIDTYPSNFLEECSSEFDKSSDFPTFERANYGLIDQPSGLCLPHFFCAFDNCYPNPDQNITILEAFNDLSLPTNSFSDMDPKLKEWVDDEENPSYNLPSKVLFPAVANDVVAAVQFAKQHGFEISVKNSGHSYTSASSKKNTLHINMNKFKQYATNDGVVDCDESRDYGESPDLVNQPCMLSLAKGKNALIRVGGGENWDKTYRAVKSANEEQEEGYKYHVVGGGAGTVSPMGWTFLGGLAGTTAGRYFGFGVDQVLMIEMVLPNGQHVKFGPTDMEEVEGYDVPKTLAVSGVCNTNPKESEDEWEWGTCPADANIDFDDLWFAVRGGGGGTWGVITSMHLQLHEYLPLERISLRPLACVGEQLTESQLQAWDLVYQTFEIKFLLDPTSINVTEDESNVCGFPAGDVSFSCYGEGSAQVFDDAWKKYLESNRKNLEDDGIATEIIDAAINCEPTYIEGTDFNDQAYKDQSSPNTNIYLFVDYAEAVTFPSGTGYPGRTMDGAPSVVANLYNIAQILIPKKWIIENIEVAAAALPPNPTTYRAFGGRNAKSTSDQSNSLSMAHRDAGYMTPIPLDYFGDNFFTDFIPSFYDTSDKTNFPGYLGANHAGINTRGPLKSDWTKACPLEWTLEDRNEKCISLQEIIYGTKLLKQLETIKEAIDPNYMFDCNGCIGNNRVKSGPTTPTSFPTTVKSPAETLKPNLDASSSAFALKIDLAILFILVGVFSVL